MMQSILFQLKIIFVLFGVSIGATENQKIFDGICFYNNLKTPLPVRYLFIQLFDRETGRNLTEDTIENFNTNDNELINVKIISDPDSGCRFRHELLNNFDGTFIFRLRIIIACKKLQIHFFSPLNPGHSFCEGPFIIDEPHLLNPEECFCEEPLQPLPPASKWITDYCPLDSSSYKQLFKDLSNFEKIDFEKTLAKVESNWGHPDQARSAAVCRFKLSKNGIKKHCYGEYTGFSMFSEDILTSLARKMELPEMEFIQNLGDWPLENQNPNGSGGVAIISWCGSNETFDIVVPTYEMSEASLKSMDIIARDMQNIKGQQFIPWEKKLNKAIFRGRDSNELRLKAAKLALERPDLIDGGITRYFFFDKETNPKEVEHRPFNEFFKYRYIISIDGTVAAYRLPYLLGGNSVVLKQDSKFHEHFYTFLKPNIHYIPFNEESLIETLEFIQTLQNGSTITKAARSISREHLQPLNIYCYYAIFLEEYAKLYQPPTSQRFLNLSMESLSLTAFKRIQTDKLCNCKTPKEAIPTASTTTTTTSEEL